MTFWRRREQSLSEEVEDYLALETMENVAAGMTPEAARAAALRKLGNATLVKEDTRSAWGWMWFERLWQDLRHGCRMLRKNPGFTAVAVLSLALGIGANSAMFSIADALLLRPLPVERPGEIVTIGSTTEFMQGFTRPATSYPEYTDLRDRADSFSGMVGFTFIRAGYATRPEELPKLTFVAAVTGNFFTEMGVEPVLGRTFRPEEDQVPGRDAVAVLDHDTWKQQFAADPSVLGRKVRLGGAEFTVVGVAPERFTSMNLYIHPTFYVPIMMWQKLAPSAATDPLLDRGLRVLTVKARLKSGVSIAQVQQEASALAVSLAQTYPETNRDRGLAVRTELQARIQEDPADSSMAAALMLLAAAVLLVACGNVGGLLTSRAPARAREIAMRMAIGAGRMRLIRQLLTESLLIALAGGALGVVIGYYGTSVFGRIQIPSDLPIRIAVQVDQRVLLVSMGIALASVILFGLIPAIQTTRTDLTSVMKGRETAPGRRRLWGRSLLVAGQVTVALVLLTVSVFVYQGFRKNLSGTPGFRTDHLVSMSFDPTFVGYSEAQTQEFYKQLVERARSAPGVKSAALASFMPMTAGNFDAGGAFVPEGYQLPPGQEAIRILQNRVDENFFDTLGVRLLQGRGFRATDDKRSALVAVVNEQVAQHYWPGQDPLGKRLRLEGRDGPWAEIIGVAETGKYAFIAEPPLEFVYVPWRQHPQPNMILLAHSSVSSASLVAPLREVVRGLDSTQPIFGVHTVEELFDIRGLKLARGITQTVGGMGVIGLALSLVGLYGLVAYSVSRRTREIGIRMAIGARKGQVLRMVLRRGLALALSGIVVGLAASIVTGWYLAGIFTNSFTITATVATSLAVAVALLVVTMLAAYIPARRASHVDPTIALRYE